MNTRTPSDHAYARIARVQLPSSTQHLEVRTPDGESLKGIRTPSSEEAAQNAPTLLGFGGNAWNAKATALTLHRLFPDGLGCQSLSMSRGPVPNSNQCIRVGIDRDHGISSVRLTLQWTAG